MKLLSTHVCSHTGKIAGSHKWALPLPTFKSAKKKKKKPRGKESAPMGAKALATWVNISTAAIMLTHCYKPFLIRSDLVLFGPNFVIGFLCIDIACSNTLLALSTCCHLSTPEHTKEERHFKLQQPRLHIADILQIYPLKSSQLGQEPH